ncbi:MAG: radical SAM protein [Clostridia bacterium]|nr:radical SAM protein [Clostridia bacterium]
MDECTLCPVGCKADRTAKAGACGVKGITVAKYCLHAFEEPALSPNRRSGAIFFGGCSLRCVFCQNYKVSRADIGKKVNPKELAEIFMKLEEAGAENIDLVTCDHLTPMIGEALSVYKPKVPVIYNSGGYCKVEALKEIDPYIDVYLPDLKFFSPEISERYTGRKNYFEYASKAIGFMAKKPVLFENGQMKSGILARHLILPCCTSDSLKVLDFLKSVLPGNAPVSLMRQYTPMGETDSFPELQRTLTNREYRRVKEYALSLGFLNLYTQESASADKAFIPDWGE